jgi:hypothetical protein
MRVAFNSPARNQIFPPGSPGRPLRLRRRSEKPDKHVRLVPLAPTVTVAEWLRRATVDRSTRVRFSPVTPFAGRSSSGRTRVFEARYGSSNLPLPSSVFFAALRLCAILESPKPGRLAVGRNFLKVDTVVRIHPRLPILHARASFNGSGHPATNRETWRFESSRPHQANQVFCRVAELVQRSIVTREDVGSSPTPTARSRRGNSASRGDWSNVRARRPTERAPVF